ncbi:isochorismate synthase [Synoicihabitans lomoniglobus]|uniref:isochorismate synthase n=1 Tax=Synoicihabitans lomoniglobus TaxID=2909285 RepID=A0AAF0CS64_9BACT|nr:isochorismate synthase [Opitutaceae bacterium LMO-M01]WED67061.1 isochorismate synthase [Opitutaceae bacterium LMO-M01]
MKVLPLQPADHASPEALRAFLSQCQRAAQADGQERLVSISITVGALDPLAVLEAIYEPGAPHFYAEHPSECSAIAGAEVAARATFAGPERFAELQRFADETFARTIAVGPVDAPFGGPHVFVGAAFADTVENDEPFPAIMAFVPRWQVARAGDVTTAVANVPVAPDADLDALAERVWRAHQKFAGFSLTGAATESPRQPRQFTSTESFDYRASVAAALRQIDAGDFEKIVLARALDIEADVPFHPLQTLDGLRERFPDCFAFSIANGRGDSFIGASPERLVRVSQGMLEADVLAGTIRRGVGAVDDAAMGAALLASDKDQREHAVVLASVRRRLEALGLALEHPAQPGLRKLANLQHLHTPVRARLPDGIRLLDALAVLHPTPAVGGAPREAAVAAIRDLEGFPRGLYAGALGWMNARGGGEFMVGIRSALVRDQRARVYAGAGIVAGSTPDKEFAETDLKFKALLDALQPPR